MIESEKSVKTKKKKKTESKRKKNIPDFNSLHPYRRGKGSL